jgi:hypothetical protein
MQQMRREDPLTGAQHLAVSVFEAEAVLRELVCMVAFRLKVGAAC